MKPKFLSFQKHPILMRVLLGILIFGCSLTIATQADMVATTQRLNTTVEYLKDQCNNSVLRDMASEAKSLLRVSESVDMVKWRLQYEKIANLQNDAAILKECATDSYLDGIFLLDADGKIRAQYSSVDITAEAVMQNVDTNALLDILNFPEKNYAVRFYDGDEAHVDVAAVGRLDEPRIIVGYFYTDERYTGVFNNSIKSIVDGYSVENMGNIVISDGTHIVASNNSSLIGQETISIPVLKKIMEKGITKKLIHCYDPNKMISRVYLKTSFRCAKC